MKMNYARARLTCFCGFDANFVWCVRDMRVRGTRHVLDNASFDDEFLGLQLTLP